MDRRSFLATAAALPAATMLGHTFALAEDTSNGLFSLLTAR